MDLADIYAKRRFEYLLTVLHNHYDEHTEAETTGYTDKSKGAT
jgi:hypothetical protein